MNSVVKFNGHNFEIEFTQISSGTFILRFHFEQRSFSTFPFLCSTFSQHKKSHPNSQADDSIGRMFQSHRYSQAVSTMDGYLSL